MTALPRAILFDLDDTILATGGKPRESWMQAVEAFRAGLYPLAPERVVSAIEERSHRYWSDPLWNREWRGRLPSARRLIVAAAFVDLAACGTPLPGPEITGAIADCFTASREADLRLFPGAVETLGRLKRERVRLALVTNGAAEPQRAKIARFSLEPYFDHLQIEGELGFGKAEERAYTHALEALAIGAEESWIVGDNLEWEVAAPQRLGIYAVWCDCYGAGLPRGCRVRPDRIIHRLPEIFDLP
jgi:putative hydrolase of the HAD superfamily